jgi:NADPH:quinone reductase
VQNVKAVVLHSGNARPVVETIARTAPIRQQIAVEIRYAGLSSCDYAGLRGAGQTSPVLGRDFAGVVTALGHDAGEFAIGERVVGIASSFGAFAESTIVDASSTTEPIASIPDAVADEVAAAIPTDGLAAFAAVEAMQFSAGATLLIVGATGSVGSLALQLAHARGANVIAAVRRSAGDAWALGASAVIVTRDADAVSYVRTTEPAGVDGVLDLVGTSTEESMQFVGIVRAGGTFVSANCVADVEACARKGVAAINLTRQRTLVDGRARLKHVMELVASRQLAVTIAREVRLDDAPELLRLGVAGHAPGKTVFRVGRCRYATG